MLALAIATLLQAPVARFQASPDPAFHNPQQLQLTRVTAMTRAHNGHILLVDEPGDQIFHLDEAGRPLAPLARTGSGPGEVRSVGAMGWFRDTLWTADLRLRRLTFFSPDLRLAYSRSDKDRCGYLPWAIAPDGRCLVLPQGFIPPDQPIPSALPLLLTRPGGLTDTLGQFIIPRMVIRYPNGESHLRQPFADDPTPVFSNTGRYFGWVGQRRSLPTGSATVHVALRDLSSGQTATFEAPFTPIPLDADSIQQYLTLATKPFAAAAVAGYADSVSRRLYRPKNLPAVARALFDSDGRLWLQNQHVPGSPNVLWRVFAFSGTPAFEIALPDRFVPMVITTDRILGTTRDNDDVPSLVQLRYGPAH